MSGRSLSGFGYNLHKDQYEEQSNALMVTKAAQLVNNKPEFTLGNYAQPQYASYKLRKGFPRYQYCSSATK